MESKKPFIICIDTSATCCTVAVSEANNILASYSINIKKLHDKLLADFTKRALNDLALPFEKIDAIAISSGPGSFTGLRIGASFVKGLTLQNSPKLISLPTLQLFSIQVAELAKVKAAESIISIISANSGMVYVQEFDLNSNPITEAKFINSSELQFDEDKFYCCDSNIFLDSNQVHKLLSITPESLAIAAYNKFNYSEFSDSELFEPEYIQEFVFKG